MRFPTILCLVFLSALSVARAEPLREPPRGSLFLAGVRAGPTTPQPFNDLSTNVMVNFEALWAPWTTGLGLFLDVGHVQPVARGSRRDARFAANGGEVSYLMTVQDVGLGGGLLYRHRLDNGFMPYLGAGMRLHLTKTLVEQYAGNVDLGSHTEQSRRYSVLGRLGVAKRLGPGELGFELNFDYAPVEQRLTGVNNTGFLGYQLSYLIAL